MNIGIGIGIDPEKVLNGIIKSGFQHEILCYCNEENAGFLPGSIKTVVSSNPEESLVNDLVNGSLDAAVRGTLPANRTLSLLKEKENVDRLLRIALLETSPGKKFLLAPVGVDEGWDISEKLSFINKGRVIADVWNLPSKTGIISGGRFGDVGRNPRVDRSLADAELLARISGAEHYEIRIEDAIQECGLIIAPDGITGNIIFRTLIFLGEGKAHGAPVLNIEHIFVDTSRVSPDFSQALILAKLIFEKKIPQFS